MPYHVTLSRDLEAGALAVEALEAGGHGGLVPRRLAHLHVHAICQQPPFALLTCARHAPAWGKAGMRHSLHVGGHASRAIR